MSEQTLRPEHPSARSLGELQAHFELENIGSVEGVTVTGVSLNSNDVRAGDLYFGIPGKNAHGAQFASAAADAGAAAIVTDAAGAELAAGAKLPIVVTSDPRAALGEISAWVYRTGVHDEHDDDDQDESSAEVQIFGITGTDGKTSTTYILDALLQQLGVTTAITTTTVRRVGERVVTSTLTTPEASELHALLAAAREDHVRAAVIEVSAQALERHRVDGVEFDVVGFTNLSHEHLEEYESMDAYFAQKIRLFDPDRSRRGVVSLDSEYGQRVVDEARIPVTTVSRTRTSGADWVVESKTRDGSTSLRLSGPEDRRLKTTISIPGAFNASNAALAIVMLVEAGYDIEQIALALGDRGIDVYVPGRNELLSQPGAPKVYVDYAHTPNAIKENLETMRQLADGRVFIVFGAAGDRDPSKRYDMGANAARGADVIVITDYNPRFEDPASIRKVLIDAVRETNPTVELHEIPDPKLGIRKAIELANPGDVVFLAGPGHETYFAVRGEKVPYSGKAEALEVLRDLGWNE